MTDSRKSQPSNAGLQRAAQLAAELVGSGTGALVGSSGGALSAIIGAMAGTTITSVGREVVARVITTKQEARVGAVFVQAGAAIMAAEIEGRSVRDDGFWKGDHSAGYEFAEGVMHVAMESFEERKIPYLGNLLANVATNPEIDPNTANGAIALSERLSWLDYKLLGILRRGDDFPMPSKELGFGNSWSTWAVKDAFRALIDESNLIHYPRKVGDRGQPLRDLSLSAATATSGGELVGTLLQVEDIPSTDLRPVFKTLTS